MNIKINEYEKLYQNLEQKLGEISIKALDCNKCSYLLKNNISTHLSFSSSFLSINVPNNFIPKQPQSFNNDESINELSIEKNKNNENEYYNNYLSKNEIEIKNKIKNLKSIKESHINNLQNEIDNLIEEINNINN